MLIGRPRYLRSSALIIMTVVAFLTFLQLRTGNVAANLTPSWDYTPWDYGAQELSVAGLKRQNGGISPTEHSRPTQKLLGDGIPEELRDILNATLGFQKIFVLSMPSRTDKRDALTISAYISGIQLEFIDGVNGSLVSERAYPVNWKKDTRPPGTIGCWRGHMNIYQKMVQEQINSALIMEDDVDWDVFIKQQFQQLALGTRGLLKTTQPPLSPYGDGWDLITTGHCGVWNGVKKKSQDYYVIDDDPTVVLPEQREWWRKPDLTPEALSGNRTRLVFSPHKFSCLASYATSLKGAARIIHHQSVLPYGEAIDSGLGAFCKRREHGDTSCLAAYPMITGVHRPAGDSSKESDRRKIEPGTVREFAQSDNLVYPVRLNLGALLKEETIVKAQFPEFAVLEEVDFAKYKLPTGRVVQIKEEEFIQEPISWDPTAATPAATLAPTLVPKAS